MITSLRLTDFRNFSSSELTPCPQGLNILYGANGSGKTSLLEAVHFLGLGNSFRSTSTQTLIRHSSPKFSLFAQIQATDQRFIPLGMEKDVAGVLKMRMDEKNITRMTEIASFLPIRVINSHSHHLFESGPIYRRKFLDWGLFYWSDGFFNCWRHYNRALKQRNALLKERRPKRELDAWTEELVRYGLELDKYRRLYVQDLYAPLASMAEELLALTDLQINYQPGWDESMEYSALLADIYQEEYRAGYTLAGPHRADLDITIDAIPIKHFLSRGQQKLLVCAMMVAQGRLLAEQVNKRVIYLIDDLPSELDAQSREKLVSLLAKQPTQNFITSIERQLVTEFISNKWNTLTKVFHVEHGHVVEDA